MNRSEILSQAGLCVNGSQSAQYGEPEDNFEVIGRLWEAYLEAHCIVEDVDCCVSKTDVAAMMCLFKIGRLATAERGGTADTWVDIAGYAACGGEIATKDEEAD